MGMRMKIQNRGKLTFLCILMISGASFFLLFKDYREYGESLKESKQQCLSELKAVKYQLNREYRLVLKNFNTSPKHHLQQNNHRIWLTYYGFGYNFSELVISESKNRVEHALSDSEKKQSELKVNLNECSERNNAIKQQYKLCQGHFEDLEDAYKKIKTKTFAENKELLDFKQKESMHLMELERLKGELSELKIEVSQLKNINRSKELVLNSLKKNKKKEAGKGAVINPTTFENNMSKQIKLGEGLYKVNVVKHEKSNTKKGSTTLSIPEANNLVNELNSQLKLPPPPEFAPVINVEDIKNSIDEPNLRRNDLISEDKLNQKNVGPMPEIKIDEPINNNEDNREELGQAERAIDDEEEDDDNYD